MQATSFAILFWAPLLLDAIMSGRFDGATAPHSPPRSQHDEVQYGGRSSSYAHAAYFKERYFMICTFALRQLWY